MPVPRAGLPLPLVQPRRLSTAALLPGHQADGRFVCCQKSAQAQHSQHLQQQLCHVQMLWIQLSGQQR